MTTPILSAAETIAASLCWLARMHLGTMAGRKAEDQVEGYWHRETCRWCAVDRKELMARILATRADGRWTGMETAFNRLERKARAARVREAQSEPWYDAVTR